MVCMLKEAKREMGYFTPTRGGQEKEGSVGNRELAVPLRSGFHLGFFHVLTGEGRRGLM